MKKKETDLSRRHFMKSAGLAGAAAGAAVILGNLRNNEAKAAANVRYVSVYESVMKDGGRMYGRTAECPGPTGHIAFEDRAISSGEIVVTEECDIVVVGAGITGMMAALKAADMGKKVIVLEKSNAGRGIFECYASINSAVLKNAGRSCSDAEKITYIRGLYETAHWRLRRGPVHTFIERSGEAADFMERMFQAGPGGLNSVPATESLQYAKYECKFNVPAFMAPGTTSAPVGRQGLYVVRELAKVGKTKYPSLFSVRYLTPAVQLIRESDGPVSGVIARDGRGYLRFNANKGVIIASGGYDSNPEMMKAYCRSEDYANLLWWNGHFGPTGDGHMMGMKAGAIMDSTPHAIMSFNFGVNPAKFINAVNRVDMMLAGTFQVNRAGKRFMDESLGLPSTSYMVNATAAQENFGKDVWRIATSLLISADAIAEYKALGVIKEASSLRGLAAECGIDPDGLEKTATDWNSFCSNGVDMEFGRAVTAASALNLGSTTFYGINPRSGCMLATVSGLQIDSNCNVLDTKDKPIPGLYAGGNASGCFFYGHYPRHISGVSIGRAMTFGFVAAEHACSRA